MPLLRVEYSENLPGKENLKEFALEVHHNVAVMLGTKVENFKSTFYPIPGFVQGVGATEADGKALLYLTLRVKPRPAELKQQAADYLTMLAEKIFRDTAGSVELMVSSEVIDIDALAQN